MGATRKLLSVSTLGLVDFYSDKERIARNTKATKRAAKQQVKLISRIANEPQHFTPQGPPPGWYESEKDLPGVHRWWDGCEWTEHTIDGSRVL